MLNIRAKLLVPFMIFNRQHQAIATTKSTKRSCRTKQKMPPAIPDRWLDYIPVGKRVAGTRFVAFKVPLRKVVIKSVEPHLRLDCDSLLASVPNLGMIIDLTNTQRYYQPEEFQGKGVVHKKLMIPGHVVPPNHLVDKFNAYVASFLADNKDNEKLIGVHCTHGVNRTGYLICSYMISELNIQPEYALKEFAAARGHSIERKNYVHALYKQLVDQTLPIARIAPALAPAPAPAPTTPATNWRDHRPIEPIGYQTPNDSRLCARDKQLNTHDWRWKNGRWMPQQQQQQQEQQHYRSRAKSSSSRHLRDDAGGNNYAQSNAYSQNQRHHSRPRDPYNWRRPVQQHSRSFQRDDNCHRQPHHHQRYHNQPRSDTNEVPGSYHIPSRH